MIPEASPLVIIVPLSVLLPLLYHWTKWSNQKLPYPPGPKPLPLIGNILDMPREGWWLTFDQWFKQYGDIVSLNLMGQRIIVLGSATAVDDLMEKRSAKYSDRVTTRMMNEVLDWNWAISFMQYGDYWKRHRRFFHQYFSQSKLRNYHGFHEKHSRILLQDILHAPDQVKAHLRRTLSNMMMDSLYGIEVRKEDDPYITNVEDALESISKCVMFGSFLVDIFPWLKYMPRWFPGTGFKAKAEKWNKGIQGMREDPYRAVREKLARNEAKECVMVDMLRDIENADNTEAEALIKNCVGIAYIGGSETTLSACHTFLVAMASYPEVQARAQREIDTVVGRDRLPSFSDQPNLPYVNAVAKELLRWHNVGPLAAPHAVSVDDVYRGYFIPKGSIVIGCTWSISHNPETYPEPHEFKPDRFIRDGKLNPDVPDPITYAFGYGRRICPGRYLGLDSLYSLVVNLLACFTVETPLDQNGNRTKLSHEITTSGVATFPKPFKVAIEPRYEGVGVLIENAVIDAREKETDQTYSCDVGI